MQLEETPQPQKKGEEIVEIYPMLKQRTSISTRDIPSPTYVQQLELGSNEQPRHQMQDVCLLASRRRRGNKSRRASGRGMEAIGTVDVYICWCKCGRYWAKVGT